MSADFPEPPDGVTLAVFVAAIQAGATHLSKDGRRCYWVDGAVVYQSEWDEKRFNFGDWEIVDELAADAVEIP